MMKLQIKSISAVVGSEGEYAVVLEDENGTEVPIKFRAGTYDNGISFVNPEPDILTPGYADSRSTCAAVMAFHRARTFYRQYIKVGESIKN
jgi:hypothetical protein